MKTGRHDERREEMQIVYDVKQETCCGEEQGWYDTYGIEARAHDAQETIYARIRDISLSEAKVKEFAEKCTREGLSLIHLREAVEDLLG